MLTQHIALVAAAGGVSPSELARVSAALQKQVTNDLGPLWGVTATVDGFPQLEDVPTGYWPIIVGLPDLGTEAGIHLDENGQPYALVELSGGWGFEASRACLDMLVNPYGDRTVTAPSPRAGQGTVEFMVEVCGPRGDSTHAYPVNGVLVSDFCTPAYYDAATASRGAASFRDALSPFELPRGGRLVWRDSISNVWWLRMRPHEEAVDTELGIAEHGLASLRELVRAREPRGVRAAVHSLQLLEDRSRLLEHQESLASRARAYRLRALVCKRLLPGAERAPVLLTDRRVPAWSGRAQLGIFTQEALDSTSREVESWVEDDAESAAPDSAETDAGASRESIDQVRALAPASSAADEAAGAKGLRPEFAPCEASHAELSGSTASQVRPLAPAQFPSIAPVFTSLQSENVPFERRGRWLAGAALAGAALFIVFGLGERFATSSGGHSQSSPRALPPAADPARLAPASTERELTVPAAIPLTAPPAPEAASSVQPLPSASGQAPVETSERAALRRKRSGATSGSPSDERAGAGQNTRSIEALIETRR